jgi:hypothetical protein
MILRGSRWIAANATPQARGDGVGPPYHTHGRADDVGQPLVPRRRQVPKARGRPELRRYVLFDRGELAIDRQRIVGVPRALPVHDILVTVTLRDNS